ncbi:MAG: protein translocase subunit SecD [Armatimonadota bacterium]|nr:protein translocase subunit SecD [Armatimonadota bacterium]
MLSRRPVQYAGLALLILACLAIIFFPVGAKPEEQIFTVRLIAPKPWAKLAAKGKNVSEVADEALAKQFSEAKGERLPSGTLMVVPPEETAGAEPGTLATIEDRASTQPEAAERAQRIVTALKKPFPGIKLAPKTEEEIQSLPQKPLFTVMRVAVFPPKEKNGTSYPAIKLGLDLQGGVNLVLQVRRALFTYKIDKNLPDDADQRDRFLGQVRDALAAAPESARLGEANVILVPGTANLLEIRTQAEGQKQFNEQRTDIKTALGSVKGYKFTEAREPQFFVPEQQGNQNSGTATQAQAYLDRFVEIVRARVDKLGVSEPSIQRQGTDRIIVQLPGVNNPQKAVEVIGKTAQLEIRLLPQDINVESDPSNPENVLFRGATGFISSNEARRRSEVIVRGDDLKPTSSVGYDQTGEAAVYFELQGTAARHFAEVTTKNVGRMMPIFLDERCISAPVIKSAITGGSGQISGGFENIEEARELALLLNSGALPAPIDVVENRTVSATLGTDSLIKSLRAGLIGIIAVIIFMIAFYRLPGVLADCALIVYCVLNLAVFILVGGTLTLPGIAGFLLALAMSLDTNILVFERLKEEMAIQPTFAAALRAAFSRAWTAILDSHVTTLIAAVVLFYLGTGPIKGFALTLAIGVLLSLFSAISVTRLFMWSIVDVGEKNRSLFAGPVPPPALATPSR